MTTPEQRAEWKRLADAATPGPWQEWMHRTKLEWPDERLRISCFGHGPIHKEEDLEKAISDMEFIAASREAVPAMLAENDELQKEVLLAQNKTWEHAAQIVREWIELQKKSAELPTKNPADSWREHCNLISQLGCLLSDFRKRAGHPPKDIFEELKRLPKYV